MGQGSSDTSVDPHLHALEAQREQAVLGADKACVCGAPGLPYMSLGKGGPQSVETKTRNILESDDRELGRLPLFCCFRVGFFVVVFAVACFCLFCFLPSSSLCTSLFPYIQVSTCLGNPGLMREVGDIPSPRVALTVGRRGPGAETPSWARGKATVEPQPGPFLQVHCILGPNHKIMLYYFHQAHK